jgi:hypothetical protein
MSAKKQNVKARQLKVVLAVLIGGIVLAALYMFVVVPMQTAHEERLEKRDKLRAEMNKAKLLLRNDVQNGKAGGEYPVQMRALVAASVPPPDNALAWASQFVYSHTRPLGLQVQSISEEPTVGAGWNQPDLAKRTFRPYAVRMDLSCSFELIRKLVHSLQEANPYMNIYGITLNADRTTVTNVYANLIIEWPYATGPIPALTNSFETLTMDKERRP